MRKKETAPLRCVVATMVFERRSIVPFGGVVRRTERIALGRVDVLGGDLLPWRSSSSERTTTTIDASSSSSSTSHPGADQIEFVYLFSPSSSSFAGMLLSLSSRRSRGNEEERSRRQRQRTSTDQQHRFFLFACVPNHNRDPNKNFRRCAQRPPKRVLRNRAKDSRGES